MISAQEVIEHMLDGVMITDAEARIQAVNPAFTAITGYSFEEVFGKNPRFLKSGRHKPAFFKRLWQTLATKGSWQGEIQNRKKNGEVYTEWAAITTVKDSDGRVTHYLGVYTDITKKKGAEKTIKQLANYDPLTGLANKSLFRTKLKQAIDHAKHTGSMLAVLLLDLDRVKVINDSLGHGIGDQLLKQVAERLDGCFSQTETVARLGGDEFMVLIPTVETLNEVSAITKLLMETIAAPFNLEGQEIYTTASVGISIYPHDGHDIDQLIKNADTAMHEAKRQGRNSYQVFTPAMKDEVDEQLELTASLRRALQNEEFEVHYQPQLEVETGKIVGMEALVRWRHPELGLISPDKFIRWAEDTKLIIPLGEWVLRKACEQTMAWQQVGLPPLRVAVNLSAIQIKEDNFVGVVEKILEETGLPPDCLDLELTESVLMDSTASSTTPYDLKAMGVKFSLDDFGTGYSSLSYLKHFPVQALKMDRSFVQELSSGSSDAAIATAIIALAHGLNLSVVAEGVETQGQLEVLKNLHCDKFQGFLFSAPLPANLFEQLIKTHKRHKEDTLFEKI